MEIYPKEKPPKFDPYWVMVVILLLFIIGAVGMLDYDSALISEQMAKEIRQR